MLILNEAEDMLQAGFYGNLQLSICYLLPPGCIMLIKSLPVQHSVAAQEERTGLCQYVRGSSNTGTYVFFCLFILVVGDGEAYSKKRLTGFYTCK